MGIAAVSFQHPKVSADHIEMGVEQGFRALGSPVLACPQSAVVAVNDESDEPVAYDLETQLGKFHSGFGSG